MPNPSECKVEYVLSKMIEMARHQPDRGIPRSQVESWLNGITNDQFFNLIGLKIAKRYADQTLSYDIADAIVNDLWSTWLEGVDGHTCEVPAPFYDIYLAFDAGEGSRSPDKDPVKEITDPWIAHILSQQRGQSN